jgi:hypothetical protein
MATSKRGLKRGLFERTRTVALMLDETFVLETPPLYAGYSRVGERKIIPISGSHALRVANGDMNVWTGDVALLITRTFDQIAHQDFLWVVHCHWPGWHIVLFEDRASEHKAEDSRAYAQTLGIEIRLLPRATPELNAMDQLWRQAKGHSLANSPTSAIDESALALCQFVIELSPRERLQAAGVRSGNFWLAR